MAVSKATHLIWMQVCIAVGVILGLTSFILVLVHFGHHGGPDRHEFCFEVRDYTRTAVENIVVGRLGVDIEEKRVCVDLYFFTIDDCTLQSIRLRGPINPTDGRSASNILVNISGPIVEKKGFIRDTDERSACYHMSSDNLRILLKNPAYNYIEAHYGGGEECSNVHRDHLTGLCHHPEFKMSDIDDDDSHDDDDDAETDDDELDNDDDDDNDDPHELPTILHSKTHSAAVLQVNHHARRAPMQRHEKIKN